MTLVAGWCALERIANPREAKRRVSRLLPDVGWLERDSATVMLPYGSWAWQSRRDGVEFTQRDGFAILLSNVTATLTDEFDGANRAPLIERLCDRWAPKGTEVLDQLGGDYALAVQHLESGETWLARSPLSSRPLHFQHGADGVLFGSLAFGLADGKPVMDEQSMVRWAASLAGASHESMVVGVHKVQPGTVWHFKEGSATSRRFWKPTGIPVSPADGATAARRLRSAMEDAVDRACLNPGGEVGALLSAGRDSSTVAMLAARELAGQGRTLYCYTASPGNGPPFEDSTLFIDEAPTAERTAAAQPNIIHRIVTVRGFRACEAMERLYRFHSTPFGNPLSLYWWESIQRAAVSDGVTVLLGGGMGNLSISDGGPQYLADLLGRGLFPTWLREFGRASRFPGTSVASLLNGSFGGFVPGRAYNLLRRLTGRGQHPTVAPFLREAFRQRLAATYADQDHRPPRSARKKTQDMLAAMDLGDIMPDVVHGLSMRDPTADRAVVEACLQLRPDQIVAPHDRRPIFERAFGDLLPEDVVRAPSRAYQSMDWNLAYDVAELREGVDRYSRHPLARELIDFAALEAVMAEWPVDRAATLEETGRVGDGVLRGISLAAYLHTHF